MGATKIIISFCVLSTVLTKEIPYKAAVVEYGGLLTASNFKQHFFDNLREYKWLLNAAAKKNVDIIVFPESTLNTPSSLDRKLLAEVAIQVPEPVDKKAPCDDRKSSNELAELSCAVREGKLYAVLNILEKYPCRPGSKDKKYDKCPTDGFYLFNSNIVFDRDGRIISRYRKTHHFGESYLNKLLQPEFETFKTDFGVTFGHVICFDALFHQPTHELLKRGVRNFVYPLMWFSELPFLTAVQFQSAWSQAYGVNLLASGASIPTQGSTGSGIFAGRSGIKTAIIVGESESKVITADLYANPETKSDEPFLVESFEADHIRMLRDSLQYYDWNFVDLSKSKNGYNDTVCSDDFCCSFYVKTKQNDRPSGLAYHYALVAFDGVRSFASKATGGVQNCGLVACTTNDFTSCGTRFSPGSFKAYVTFENVKISGNFESKNSTQMPVSLTNLLLPTKHADSSFSLTKRASDARVVHELIKPHDDLLTFGIFGRKFSLDSNPVSKKSPVLENARKGRNMLMFNHGELVQNRTDHSDKTAPTNSDSSENFTEDHFSYVWGKLRIALALLAIYILEMM